MINELDCYCAKVKIYNESREIVYENFLSKMPLSEKAYEIKGVEILGNAHPCMLERKYIDRVMCVQIINKIDKKEYSFVQLKWFFDLYDVKGDYVVFEY